jgi:hypothetical protein
MVTFIIILKNDKGRSWTKVATPQHTYKNDPVIILGNINNLCYLRGFIVLPTWTVLCYLFGIYNYLEIVNNDVCT